MSVVTGIMLIVGFGEEERERPLAEVQQWLHDRCGQKLVDVADHAGGWKHPQFHAMAAGINRFVDEDEFARFVCSRNWSCPENVVLILQPEEGQTRLFRPGSYGSAVDLVAGQDGALIDVSSHHS